MNSLICHIAPLGLNPDWIKQGILYYDWNLLLILITDKEEYLNLAEKLKSKLEPSYSLSDNRKLDEKLIKRIEIIKTKSRDILEFISLVKGKLKEVKAQGYDVYFNATSGLELWKFAAYFISATEHLIDKFYYIPKDSEPSEPIKPLEIHLPIPISESLRNILNKINSKEASQKILVKNTGLSKGMISRYVNELIDLELIDISGKKRGKEQFFQITEKGKWYL